MIDKVYLHAGLRFVTVKWIYCPPLHTGANLVHCLKFGRNFKGHQHKLISCWCCCKPEGSDQYGWMWFL